jgi:formate dehydrogenase major subunit
MAECHPVAFQWVMEAKARGAKVIHVDPRFNRTSAVADLYLPLRAGSDIAFVGGLINYVLSSGRYFKDYVLAYTNAATILTEDYADTEDLDGVFSGLNREHRYYDFDTWCYQGAEEVKPASGTHQDPDARQRTPRRPAVERAQGAGLVGRGTAAVGRGRRPRLHRRPSSLLPAARRGDRRRRDLRCRFVHHAG